MCLLRRARGINYIFGVGFYEHAMKDKLVFSHHPTSYLKSEALALRVDHLALDIRHPLSQHSASLRMRRS